MINLKQTNLEFYKGVKIYYLSGLHPSFLCWHGESENLNFGAKTKKELKKLIDDAINSASE